LSFDKKKRREQILMKKKRKKEKKGKKRKKKRESLFKKKQEYHIVLGPVNINHDISMTLQLLLKVYDPQIAIFTILLTVFCFFCGKQKIMKKLPPPIPPPYSFPSVYTQPYLEILSNHSIW